MRRDLETHSFAGNAEWKLTAANGYLVAANLSESAEDAERLRSQSRSIYQDVLATWPSGNYAMQAHLGLSATAPDINAKISSLRDALRAEPGRSITMSHLANALVNRNGNGDTAAAADLYRQAFFASGSSPVWSYAQNALRLYASAGQTDRASTFKDRIARDSGMIDFAEEVASERFAEDLERAETVLQIACDRYVLTIFGREICAAGLDSLVAATRLPGATIAQRQALAGVAVKGMRELRIAEDGQYETEDARRIRLFQLRSTLQEWIDTGAATAEVYVMFATLPSAVDGRTDDLSESVSAFESAVELAPDNGQYRFWLALGYIEQGRFDQAIEHLALARDTLPENGSITLDSVDRAIRRAELAGQ